MEETKKPYHRKNLKHRILRQSLQIVRKEGVKGLTLRKVAQKLRVSHTAPYRHFANKADLVAAVALEGFRLFYDLAARELDELQNPLDKLSAYGKAYISFAVENPEYFRIMFGEPSVDYVHHPELRKKSLDTFYLLFDIILECKMKKLTDQGSAIYTAISAWASVHGLASLIVENRLSFLPRIGQPIDMDKTVARLFEDFRSGMLAER